jgi:hypothetical protein
MARPDNPDDYVRYETQHGLIVYVSRDLLQRLETGTRRVRFYIGGYGGYWLALPKPTSIPSPDVSSESDG